MTKQRGLVLAGASGVGKGSVNKILVATGAYKVCVSCTTRKRRPEEIHGEHYFFMYREDFERIVADGGFIEWKEVHDNLYGTLRTEVKRIFTVGRIPILEIDVQGALELLGKRDELFFTPFFVFLSAPSPAELEKRLRGRGTETEESIVRRLAVAVVEERSAKDSGAFTFVTNGKRLLQTADRVDRLFLSA
jgi:guanylate kinase